MRRTTRSTIKRSRPVPRRIKRKHRSVKLKSIIMTVLVISLLGTLIFAAFFSPLFYIKAIKIVGLKTIPVKEIVSYVPIDFRDNIFLISKKNIQDALRLHPVIRDVRIYRKLPGMVVIRVEERKPYLILNDGQKKYLLDNESVPFKNTNDKKIDLPLIICKPEKRPILGKTFTEKNFLNALQTFELSHEYKLTPVEKITVDLNGDLCLNVRDGFQVKLGRPERISEKIKIAAQWVQDNPKFRKYGRYIDVTSPEAPAFKMRGDAR